MKRTKKTKGFTLVEIMIVVLIIGILVAIAVPNFLNARTKSQAKTCISNLKQIEGAKEQALMENAPIAAMADLVPTYIKTTPTCPTAGAYTIGAAAVRPTCSIGGTHVLP